MVPFYGETRNVEVKHLALGRLWGVGKYHVLGEKENVGANNGHPFYKEIIGTRFSLLGWSPVSFYRSVAWFHSMVKLETWKSSTWLLVDYWGLETVLSFQASRLIRL